MGLTTPNQILHYTASAANYPTWAIRVGNFALTDVGNNVSGSWGTFRLGLNPKSFTFNSTLGQYGINGFAKQTYAVYIYKPDLPDPQNCKGPSCFLLDNVKIVPNTNENYPGDVSTTNPWYHLVKFTQWIGASSSLVGNYNDDMEDVISTFEGRVNNTLRWYRDQLSLGDARTYEGGTAGNRVVVNKFYPPIIANTSSRIFDSSYVASVPWMPGPITSGTKIYNLAGLTHGVVSNNESIKYWDYEGGYMKTISGDTLFNIPEDNGFALSGAAQEPSFWTLNMYVMMSNANTNYDQFLIKSGGVVDNPNDIFMGLGFRNDSGIYRLTLSVRLNGGNSRSDYTINGASFSLNQWYYISVVRNEQEKYTFYINGKYVDVSAYIGPFQQSYVGSATSSVLYNGPVSSGTENAYKNIQYLSYYPVEYNESSVRENFLRYTLNSKIKNSNIRIALDTGTKTSHQGSAQWVDISGYGFNGKALSNFSWQDYKPAWTTKQGDILRGSSSELDFFASSPFCLSIWFYIVDDAQNFNIFYKGLDSYFTIKHVATSTIQVSTEGNNVGQYSGTIGGIIKEKWHNIFVTGTKLDDVKFFIFTHTNETENVARTTLTGGGIIDPTVGNTDDIRFGDTGDYCRIASIIYWNTNFSEALCREFFSIQKVRFGMDSYSNRIADGDPNGCIPV
jgi:hypothetical protein